MGVSASRHTGQARLPAIHGGFDIAALQSDVGEHAIIECVQLAYRFAPVQFGQHRMRDTAHHPADPRERVNGHVRRYEARGFGMEAHRRFPSGSMPRARKSERRRGTALIFFSRLFAGNVG